MSGAGRILLAAALLAGANGCASVPADWGRGEALALAAERGRASPATGDVEAWTARLLAAPLTAETAVQLALVHNPELRRETARLGFAAAEVYDAGRLANPVFSLTRLAGDSSAAAAVPQLTLGLAVDFANLLFLPANRRIAAAQFEAEKQAVAARAVDLAADVERAWFEAVAAEQLHQMREAASRAQAASAALARRYFEAGNLSPRERAIEQAAASRMALAAISAGAEATVARTRLNRLIGLGAGQGGWRLDARLGEPLPAEDDVAGLQRLALDSRLDVAALRGQAAALADRYGLTRRTRLVNGLTLGIEHERDYDGGRNTGPSLALELPLFNWGGGRTAAAQAALARAEAELDGRVLDVSNEVQLAAARVQAARALSREYRERLIPEQEAVVAQAQAEQNYMLIAVFEVILAQQQVYDAYAGYIAVVRDYWTARTDLARAVGRTLPSTAQPTAALDPAAWLAPAASRDDPHAGHRQARNDDGAAVPAAPAVEPPDPHAGHAGHGGAPAAPAASATDAVDPHAGHRGVAGPPVSPVSPAPPAPEAPDPHAGHHPPNPDRPAADPHAGHHHSGATP